MTEVVPDQPAEQVLPFTGDYAPIATTEISSAPGDAMADTDPAPKDIQMQDVATDVNTTAHQATSTTSTTTPAASAASPAAAPAATGAGISRAASALPAESAMPAEVQPHGAPARQYLNAKVTAVLVEGMKAIAKDQPHNPLRVLGEFLLQKSKELETQA